MSCVCLVPEEAKEGGRGVTDDCERVGVGNLTRVSKSDECSELLSHGSSGEL